MASFNLEGWVLEQFHTIGFRDNGDFIGKSKLKKRLTQKYPKRKAEIYQLVNNISRTVFLSNTTQISKPKPPKKQVVLAKAVATNSKEKPTKATQSSQLQRQAESGMSAKSIRFNIEERSDSGFETGNECVEQEHQEGVSLGTSTPIMDSQIQSSSEMNVEPPELQQEIALTARKDGETPRSLADKQMPSNSKISELRAFVQEAIDADDIPFDGAEGSSSVEELRLKLLHFNPDAGILTSEDMSNHSIRNSVLFSDNILATYGQDVIPQYGLLGSCDATSRAKAEGSSIFLNTNIPFSAFICGVQGSGKSHTSTCMIENCLIPTPILGVLQKPLSALVFNFAEYTSRSNFKPSEAAFLAAPSQKFSKHLKVQRVNVLVSPSNYIHLNALYTQIPGVEVQPFMLHPKDLNIGIMLTLMSVDQSQGPPLYMGTVTKILRKMATESSGAFDYVEFRRRLQEAGLDRKQEEFLNQRLDLLESFLDLDGSTTSPRFNPGEVTIIDLSCPFVDPGTACVLFKIGMGMFLESDAASGKVIFVDEAHKFMTDTPGSKALTESLMGVIRQQRHYGARVIISTQEPTISPQLIDLCSITAIHRFSSPQWLSVLRQHISIPDKDARNGGGEAGLFQEILRLKTGEALIFAPSAMVGAQNEVEDCGVAAHDLLRMRVRGRVTWDGGRSIVSV